MANDRFTRPEHAVIPHLEKGAVADLRGDMNDCFERVAQHLEGFLSVKMDEPPDVSGGANSGIVGFQVVEQFGGLSVASEVLLQFAVFDDINVSSPSVSATLGAAVEGSIIQGEGGPALKVKTDASGRFSCVLTDTVDESVHLSIRSDWGGPSVDSRDTMTVVFSA